MNEFEIEYTGSTLGVFTNKPFPAAQLEPNSALFNTSINCTIKQNCERLYGNLRKTSYGSIIHKIAREYQTEFIYIPL